MCTDINFGQGSGQRTEFQFPSNGKAHVHQEKPKSVAAALLDNLCFNSLQTGKHMCTSVVNSPLFIFSASGFNSLQTGKHMCTDKGEKKEERTLLRFNSLQTGKHMCTCDKAVVVVPVPEFQFPSNGKAHVHRPDGDCANERKRLFQFPSNGKAHVHA